MIGDPNLIQHRGQALQMRCGKCGGAFPPISLNLRAVPVSTQGASVMELRCGGVCKGTLRIGTLPA